MIKKIGIDELAVGMQVCGIKKTHGEASFFLNNMLIRTGDDIKGLRESLCDVVYVDTGRLCEPYEGPRKDIEGGLGAEED
ncbi:MAG TPA: DUF3391 domain-containing protein, partial [Thermodesulfobacteriota bacterium]|nr:DUF3391 domain-containing protein [Thermodesulfobacteriota bacterium]